MHMIHFTEGATDPLQEFRAQRARFVPLADGGGDTHVSCLYLDAGAQIGEPPSTHDCALLIVHGEVDYASDIIPRLQVSSGVGMVMKAGECYTLASPNGAIALLVESGVLAAHERGISTPQRIMGQLWPGERDGRAGTHSYLSCEVLEGASAASPSLIARRSSPS